MPIIAEQKWIKKNINGDIYINKKAYFTDTSDFTGAVTFGDVVTVKSANGPSAMINTPGGALTVSGSIYSGDYYQLPYNKRWSANVACTSNGIAYLYFIFNDNSWYTISSRVSVSGYDFGDPSHASSQELQLILAKSSTTSIGTCKTIYDSGGMVANWEYNPSLSKSNMKVFTCTFGGNGDYTISVTVDSTISNSLYATDWKNELTNYSKY